ncbi:BppU family phage baseplate upper protein, partial [Staphylococcus aureus]|uniref:BppU family phage baseplate upper protein n=1 Tax=Staphylococcus aureus TaxID=1280 RepID=UPI0037D99630
AIGKEVHVDMLDDIVERILLKDIERFRGPKGDNVSDYVTRHVGRVQAKLFLIDEDSSTDDSSHVADFYFKVNDSGLTKAIGKEVHVDMLDDIVERILLKDIERFRGPKGD